jgi:hypothetical protein
MTDSMMAIQGLICWGFAAALFSVRNVAGPIVVIQGLIYWSLIAVLFSVRNMVDPMMVVQGLICWGLAGALFSVRNDITILKSREGRRWLYLNCFNRTFILSRGGLRAVKH